MKRILFLLLASALLTAQPSSAQKVIPSAYYTDEEGYNIESTTISDAQAPLDVTFKANPNDMEDYSPSYEWHFRKMDTNEGGWTEFLVRYEEDTQYTFRESGTFSVVLKMRLEQDGIEDSTIITVTIVESRLEFPNAFSPNGDGINDVYKAKEYKSIVAFHAIIINRWGQKLYEWDNPAEGWDGKHNGTDVKQGVYYVLVKARGADGRHYNIRKDVNLLRGFTEGGSTTTTGQ